MSPVMVKIMGKGGNKGQFRPGKEHRSPGRGGARIGAGRKPKIVEDAIKQYGIVFQRLLDKKYNVLANAYLKFAQTDPSVAKQLMSMAFPTLSKSEIVGKDGRPLVPVSIVMPDLDAPSSETPSSDNQEPVPPAGELH